MVKSYPELVLWKGHFCCSFLIYTTKNYRQTKSTKNVGNKISVSVVLSFNGAPVRIICNSRMK